MVRPSPLSVGVREQCIVNGVTVFDTNAYQGLSSGLLDALIASERRDGIVAYADPWVAIELIGKLVDPKSRPYARAAIKKLYYHCGGGATPRMIVDCEDQVCRLLLNRIPNGYAEARAAVGTVIARVALSKDDDPLEDVMRDIEGLAEHMRRVEEERANTVFDGIIQVIVPGATSWDAISRDQEKKAVVLASIDSGEAFSALIDSEIRRAHETVGLPFPEPIPQWMQQALAKNFPYPFHFEVAMIRGVVEHGWATSARGRRNSVWDAQIAFDAGQTMKGSGTITLVTNEALFHEVAAAIRQTGVQRLPDYLAVRGIAA